MEYQLIRLPVPVEFTDPLEDGFHRLSSDEAKVDGQWFVDNIRERIAALAEAVCSSDRYSQWQPDGSDGSFGQLGEWFAEHLTVRTQSRDEIKQIYDNAPVWFRDVAVESWDLSEETYSLCFDIGMYFGQSFVNRNSRHTWQLLLKQPKNIFHHQMLVTGFGQADCCPVHLVTVLAFKLHRRRADGASLLALRRTWEGIAA